MYLRWSVCLKKRLCEYLNRNRPYCVTCIIRTARFRGEQRRTEIFQRPEAGSCTLVDIKTRCSGVCRTAPASVALGALAYSTSPAGCLSAHFRTEIALNSVPRSVPTLCQSWWVHQRGHFQILWAHPNYKLDLVTEANERTRLCGSTRPILWAEFGQWREIETATSYTQALTSSPSCQSCQGSCSLAN